MIDKGNKSIKKEACGKSRTKYMCYCKICNIKLGYKRESIYNKSGKCRTCSQREAKAVSKEVKSLYPNVDFNDSQDIPYNKVKSKGNSFKRHYRVKCAHCGSDKGYVRRSLFLTRCYKCTMTKARKIEISAVGQGVAVEEWDGYISPENTLLRQSQGGREWRKQVFELANYTCDITGERGGSLQAHHLEAFNINKDLRFDVDNGVCLSKQMHKEFHKIYGKGNNTKEQYGEFKKAKLKELGLSN